VRLRILGKEAKVVEEGGHTMDSLEMPYVTAGIDG
jgi:hypothetical protein